MKIIQKHIQELYDMEQLIIQLNDELSLMRNLVLRYRMKHGESIEGGVVEVPKNISFSINIESGGVTCKQIDHEKINIQSRYQRITEKLERFKHG